MRSTFHGLEVAKTGIFAQQNALYTTGHNISNANTRGYTRQVVNMQAQRALPYPGLQASKNPGQLGTGAIVTDIQRIRESYLDTQFRNEIKHAGYWQAREETLEKIELILMEPSDSGLSNTLDRFWASWQDLAKEPEASAARAVIVERAQAVIETLSSMRTGLINQQNDLNNVISTKVSEVNSLMTQIRDLNDQIGRIEPHGYNANDLKDQRDVLIDDLSKLVNVDAVQPVLSADGRDTGMVRILAGNVALVDGRQQAEMGFVANEYTGLYDVTYNGAKAELVRGEILGLLESRGENIYPGGVIAPGVEPEVRGIINDVIAHIDTLAVELAKQINDIHSTGLNQDDIKNGITTPGAGESLLFFIDKEHYERTGEFISPTDSGNFMIHPEISKSLDKIAAAQSGAVGDGTNANAIASLKFHTVSSFPETATFDDFYRNLLAEIGVQVTEAGRLGDNSQVMVNQVENRRQSVSGVSLDEEVSNMIKFQHAYNASSRMITTMDEILDKVINGMGIVGR